METLAGIMHTSLMEKPTNRPRKIVPRSGGEQAKRVRKGRMLVEVRERVARGVRAFADQRAKDNTEAANDLLIEALEKRGLWPPPEDDV